MLVRICKEKGLADESYIHHIALVSAKTQYGIEELVSRLMYDWARKGASARAIFQGGNMDAHFFRKRNDRRPLKIVISGDVYILGCTNVGKSSLFNSLMGSDYTRAMAGDFLTRATTCLWPGTSLHDKKSCSLPLFSFREDHDFRFSEMVTQQRQNVFPSHFENFGLLHPSLPRHDVKLNVDLVWYTDVSQGWWTSLVGSVYGQQPFLLRLQERP